MRDVYIGSVDELHVVCKMHNSNAFYMPYTPFIARTAKQASIEDSRAAEMPSSRAAKQPNRRAAEKFTSRAAEQLVTRAANSIADDRYCAKRAGIAG
jgi:hypothetical protein